MFQFLQFLHWNWKLEERRRSVHRPIEFRQKVDSQVCNYARQWRKRLLKINANINKNVRRNTFRASLQFPSRGPAYNYLQLMFHEVFANRTGAEHFVSSDNGNYPVGKLHEIFRTVPLPPPPPRPRDTAHPRKLVSYWLNITMNGLISTVPRHAPRCALGFLSIKACVQTRVERSRVYRSPVRSFY